MDIKEKLEQAVEIRKNQLKQDKERKEVHKQMCDTMITNLINEFLADNLPMVIELGFGSLELELERKDITSALVDTLEPYANTTGEPKGFIEEYVPKVYHPYLTGIQVFIRRYSYPFRMKDKVEVSIVFYAVTQL